MKRTLRGNKGLLRRLLAFLRGNFLKLHTEQLRRVTYKRYKFDSNRSVMKGTLLEKQSTFSTVSRLLFEGFYSKTLILNTLCMSYSDASFVAIGNNERHFKCRTSTFSAVPQFPFEGIS